MTVCASTESLDCRVCQALCNLGLCQSEDRSISEVLVALRDTLLGPLVTKTHRELSASHTSIHTSNKIDSLCVLSGRDRREILLALKEETQTYSQ